MPTCPRAWNTLMLAVVAAFAVPPPAAQAAYVVVVADPLLGAVYPGQGWSAQGALYIPDDCYSTLQSNYFGEGFFQLNLGNNNVTGCMSGYFGDRSGVKLTDVKVKLYNNDPGNVFDTIVLGDYLAETGEEAAYGHNALARLIDIGFNGAGEVVSFHTTLSNPTPTNVPLGGDLSTSLQLQFSKDFVVGRTANGAAPNGPAATDCNSTVAGDGAILCVTGVTAGGTRVIGSTAPDVSPGRVLSNAEYAALNVPEPGSLALGLTALAAAWLARRRRSSRWA